MDEGLTRILRADDLYSLSRYPNLEQYKDHALSLCIDKWMASHRCTRYLISCGAKLRVRHNLRDVMIYSQRRSPCMELVQMCIDTGVVVATEDLQYACYWQNIELSYVLLRNWTLPKEAVHIPFHPHLLGSASLYVPKLLIEHGVHIQTCTDICKATLQCAVVRNALAEHDRLCRAIKKECIHIAWCLKQRCVSKWIIRDLLMYVWELKIGPHRK